MGETVWHFAIDAHVIVHNKITVLDDDDDDDFSPMLIAVGSDDETESVGGY